MLTPTQRKKLIQFLDQHADGDVLVQACNRVIDYAESVDAIIKWKAPVASLTEFLSENREANKDVQEKPTEAAPIPNEDLGPAPKKLGANGQAIHKLLEDRGSPMTVEAIGKKLKLSSVKVKPQLALLIDRNMVIRSGHNEYEFNK